MYQQSVMDNGQTYYYAPQLSSEDVLKIELIAEQMRAKFIHGQSFSSTGHVAISTSLSRALSSGLEVSRLWLERSRSRGQLAKMDARLLSDIGVTRTDANQEARKWFWQA